MKIYPTPREIETARKQIAAGYPSNAEITEAEIERDIHETELLAEYLDEPFLDIIE
jgi:hypothetical protein